MAAFQISKGWRHEITVCEGAFGNPRLAYFFASFIGQLQSSSYFILFNLLSSFLLSTEQGSMSLCWIYMFPSSIKQLSTIQGSMSLCWTHYFIHYHLTLHHPTAHFTSVYFFNGVSLLQTGINKPIDLSTSLRFTTTVKQESSTALSHLELL